MNTSISPVPAGKIQMMVALDGARIIGAASVRNYNHLSLLFVDEEYHHRGVGRSLMGRMCEYLKKEAGERYMSLKAAPYAVDFYRKLGFHAVHAEEAFSGDPRNTDGEIFIKHRKGYDVN